MPEKQTNQERLKEITERIEAGIRDILESGDIQKYQEYLRTMSRFHRYSVNNQILIHLQCPNATLVAGYSKWEKQFSRHVMQGEKGITIIAPTPYKKKIEQEKLDPDTKLPLLDENGDVIMEEKEIKIPMFRPVKVFDYSQTDGKPLPEHVASPVAALTGDVENYEVFMEALRRSSPVPIQIKPLSSDLDGFFSPDTQSITLREGMSQVQTVCAAVHELAHARLHNYKKPESTFDAYLWQTVENKQKFISQIMTSKSPVRSCEDIDETALSYAEIKALCAGDERIKEKMDLDVDIARLKLMKANHQSQQYRLEDNILRYFPEQIEQAKGIISGLEADMKTLALHPHPKDSFAGMEVRGDFLTDKDNAGAAILEAFKDAKGLEPVPIGSYRGFAMSLTVENFGRDYILTLKGQMSHRVELGKDARGNLVRIDNVLNNMPERLTAQKARTENLYAQIDAAKAELGKPFPQETELRDKSARLAELNAESDSTSLYDFPRDVILRKKMEVSLWECS